MKPFVVDITHNTLPTIHVPPGTVVVWRNKDKIPHSAETDKNAVNYFNAGAIFPGKTSAPIHFDCPLDTEYLCRFHTGMSGRVVVSSSFTKPEVVDAHDHDMSHDHKHFHGFVTGGRTGDRLFMTHTPVLADERHHYQVILRGHFAKSRHRTIYNRLRRGKHGDGLVQIFHRHMEMFDIGNGTITELPEAIVDYWPGGSKTTAGPTQTPIRGLQGVPVIIDEVLHFHTFDTEAGYPPELTYLVYGDDKDTFIDHYIDAAPSFHSVARLAAPPAGWSGKTQRFTVPGKSMRAVDPPVETRRAMVDNAFNIYYLLPPGFLPRQSQDPLIIRSLGEQGPHRHVIKLVDGPESQIEISRFVWFDLRLLNYGVFLPQE